MVKQAKLPALPVVRVPEPPEGREHIVIAKFSGGRSSALACRAAVEQDACHRVVFNNTGLESPETYAFIKAVNEQWLDGRLEILERRRDGVRLLRDVSECATKGEPIQELIEDEFLPSPMNRLCTTYLKVKCTFRALYPELDYRNHKISSVIGFRADEPSRLARLRDRNDAIAMREDAGRKYLKWTDMQVAPLADAGWTREDVLAYYAANPLEGLEFEPADASIRLSNCVGCFMSNQEELLRVAKHQPEYADFWDEMERINYAKRGDRLGAREEKVKRIIRAGEEPLDDFEIKGYAMGRLPWSVIKRSASKRRHIPIQSSVFEPGGCGDGECGLDV